VVVLGSRFLIQWPMHQKSLSIARELECIGEVYMLPSTQILDVQWVCGCYLHPWGLLWWEIAPLCLSNSLVCWTTWDIWPSLTRSLWSFCHWKSYKDKKWDKTLFPPLLEGLIWMPFIDLRKFPLSGFPYHTHNSLSVPVFTSYTLFIHPISHTISIIIFIPIHPFIPLELTLLLYNKETHVFLYLDPSYLSTFSGSTDFSTCIPQVNLWVFIT